MHEIVPEVSTTTRYSFRKMADNVDEALGFSQRECGEHFYKDATSFADWWESKGYPSVDADGNVPSSSQIWYKEFQEEIKAGIITEVPYLDFWHWQMEHCLDGELYNGCTVELYIGLDEDVLFNYDGRDIEDWHMTIQKKYNELFSSIAKDDWVTVEISW